MKSKNKKRKSPLLVIIFIIILLLACGGAFAYSKGLISSPAGERITTITDSTLREVIEVSELSTAEYTYNAVTKVTTDDGLSLKYHVAYDGIVKAGIDFDKIVISINEDDKKITITLPEVRIINCNVDSGTLQYIFDDDKYDVASVSAEAYSKCIDDLKKRTAEEDELINLAKENAISTVKGLIEPWVEQIDNKYTVEVN